MSSTMNKLPTPMFHDSVKARGSHIRHSLRLRTASATSIVTRPTCDAASSVQRPRNSGTLRAGAVMWLIFTPHAPQVHPRLRPLSPGARPLVPQTRARSPLAPDPRSLPGAGLRVHAPADPGVAGAGVLRSVSRALSDHPFAGRGADGSGAGELGWARVLPPRHQPAPAGSSGDQGARGRHPARSSRADPASRR